MKTQLDLSIELLDVIIDAEEDRPYLVKSLNNVKDYIEEAKHVYEKEE